MAGILNTLTVKQIGMIVRDVEVTKVKMAEFLGMPVPPTQDIGEYEVIQTRYKGQAAPDAKCKMAFFDLDNIQLELIEPYGGQSTWMDYLQQHGEGVHHIAFGVKGTDQVIATCETAGFPCVQRGVYGGADGEYAYMDATDSLKLFFETLESY